MNDERPVFLFGFIGDNGTGKTVTAREIAIDWKSTRPGQDVMGFDPTDGFKGVVNKFIYPHEDWNKKALRLRNALLILDEIRILHPNDKASGKLMELMSMRRKFSIDIIYIVHNPGLVLELLTYYTSKYFIYYTESKEGTFKKKMRNYSLAHGASVFINKYVEKFGIGQYPMFPYIILDNKTKQLDSINMPQEKVLQLL